MLSFAGQQGFTIVYDCLEAVYEAHLDGFEAQYGCLSEDDYNGMADQLGFVDEQPLMDFENTMSFIAARRVLADEEEQLILVGGDPSDSPILISPYDDNIIATFFNENDAVMINGVIHFIDDNGAEWTFCDCTIYEQRLQDPNSVRPEEACSMLLKEGVVDYSTCKGDWMQKCSDMYSSYEKVNSRL